VVFWNAIVNWNIVDEVRFSELRAVFIEHGKLKDLLDFMLRRVERKDEESIYFLTLLFDADDFIERLVRDSTLVDVRKKCMDCIFTSLINLLTLLDIADNPGVLLLETLVSMGAHAQARKLLLHDWHKQLLELVGLFVSKFDIMLQHLEANQGNQGNQGNQANQSLSAQSGQHVSTKKLFALFFRFYGAVHDDEQLFVQHLLDHFSGSRGALKLQEHLQVFQNNGLLKDNENVDAEDKDKYYFLFLAFRKRIEAKEREETAGACSALLSRSVVERFKSMHSVGFKLPFALVCSSTFVNGHEALENANAQGSQRAQDALATACSSPNVADGVARADACDADANIDSHGADVQAASQDSPSTAGGSQVLQSGEARKRKAPEAKAPETGAASDSTAAQGCDSQATAASHSVAAAAAQGKGPAMGIQDKSQPKSGTGQESSGSLAADRKSGVLTSNDQAAQKRMRMAGANAQAQSSNLQGLGGDKAKLKDLKELKEREERQRVCVSDDDEDYEALSEPDFIDPAEWESDTDTVSAQADGLVVHALSSLSRNLDPAKAKPGIKALNAEKAKAAASNLIATSCSAPKGNQGRENGDRPSMPSMPSTPDTPCTGGLNGREQLRDKLEKAMSNKDSASLHHSAAGAKAGKVAKQTGDAADGVLHKSATPQVSVSASQGKPRPDGSRGPGRGSGEQTSKSAAAAGRLLISPHHSPSSIDGNQHSQHLHSQHLRQLPLQQHQPQVVQQQQQQEFQQLQVHTCSLAHTLAPKHLVEICKQEIGDCARLAAVHAVHVCACAYL